jgi:hypothetical protein
VQAKQVPRWNGFDRRARLASVLTPGIAVAVIILCPIWGESATHGRTGGTPTNFLTMSAGAWTNNSSVEPPNASAKICGICGPISGPPGGSQGSIASGASVSLSVNYVYNGLYWVGANWGGSAMYFNLVTTTIAVPSSGPSASDDYDLLLSTWDNNGAYDQFGFASDYSPGVTTDDWDVMYAMGINCGTYWPGPNLVYTGYFLQPGATYTFAMGVGQGLLDFQVFNGGTISGSLYFSATLHSTATTFEAGTNLGQCAFGNSNVPVQVYEEVHKLTLSSFPQWDFQFEHTQVTNWPLPFTVLSSGWTGSTAAGGTSFPPFPCPCVLPSSPHGYYFSVNGASTTIANEVMTANLLPQTVGAVAGTHYSTSGSIGAVGPFCAGTSCAVSLACGFNGWVGSASTAQGTVPTNWMFSFTVPSGTPKGQVFYLGCVVLTTASGLAPPEWTSQIVYVYT